MSILVLDNYDSFTYNLVNYVRNQTDANIAVFRNDEISLEAVGEYDKILLSPGPGLPNESGILMTLIKQYAPTKSIFGVCLGHQAIAEVFGGSLRNLSEVHHGLASTIKVQDKAAPLFKGLPERFQGGRYHSWVVNEYDLPECLQITAVEPNGEIMAMRHQSYDVRSVQFHPESVLTEYGMEMVKNWLAL